MPDSENRETGRDSDDPSGPRKRKGYVGATEGGDAAAHRAVRLQSITDTLTGSTKTIDHDDVWTALTDTMSRYDSQSHATTEPGTASAANGSSDGPVDATERQWTGLARVPDDFVIKTSVRFLAEDSFGWCKRQGADMRSEAMEDFLKQADDSADPGRLFAAGLLYYQFPSESSLPRSLSKSWQDVVRLLYSNEPAKNVDLDKLEIIENRLATWEAALRSVYFRWRSGQVSRFYLLLGAQALFFARRSSGSLSVTMTRSTPSQRAQLEDMGVHCAKPLAAKGASEQVEESARSLLHFEDVNDVHGLYEFVLAMGPLTSGMSDVPTVLCENAFVGASIASLSISLLQPVHEAQGQDRHLLEIRGSVLPRNLQRMTQALLQRHGSFEGLLINDKRLMEVNAFADGGGPPEEALDASRRPFQFAAKHPEGEGPARNDADGKAGRPMNLGRRSLTKISARGGLLSVTAALSTSSAR